MKTNRRKVGKKSKKKLKLARIIKFVISLIMLVLSLVCYGYVYKLNILPNKYLYLFLGILLFLNILGMFLVFLKKIIGNVFYIILYILLAIISIFGIKYAGNTNKFLDKGFNNNIEYVIYNVVVSSDSEYMSLDDLNNTSMGYLFIDINEDKYLDEISVSLNVELKELGVSELYDGLFNSQISSMVINEAFIELFEQEYPGFTEKVKVLDAIKIEKASTATDKETVKELKPLHIYLSGSDSRSGEIASSTLSDVNMIVTVNPHTRTVLLTNIPRDYYVRLHGTTGNKDKLTHAGMYGIDMSIKTIEDFMGIDIDYSVKIGFRSVIKLVDLVGGVDVYSEIAFRTYSSDGGAQKVNVKKGMNHFNGAQALSYARERFAYSTGDVHRGQNQQQIIEAVLSKIMSDKSLLLKYDSLLNEFSKLYKTDIPKEVITLLIKQQLDDMSSWNIEKQTLVGFDASNYTYTWPGQRLYVMIPDEKSIIAAQEKIASVYTGTTDTVEN